VAVDALLSSAGVRAEMGAALAEVFAGSAVAAA
jgi:hypothetical protein